MYQAMTQFRTGIDPPISGWSSTAHSHCCRARLRLSKKAGRNFARGDFGGRLGSLNLVSLLLKQVRRTNDQYTSLSQ